MAINLRDYSRTPAQRGWGPGWPSCAGAKGNLATITFKRSGTRVTVHKRIARLVLLVGDEQERLGYLMKPGQTGAYNCRNIAGTSSPSLHSWALALDENWTDNPYTANVAAAKNRMPIWVPRLWNRFGFAWGGDYSGSRKDLMHLEQMGTPAEVDEMTAQAEREFGHGLPPVPIIPPAPTANITWIQEADMALPVLYAGDGRRGPRGPVRWYVMTAQACLQVRGLKTKVAVTGEFDTATVAAVKELQARQKITADGTVGPATWPWVLGNLAPDWA